LQKDKRTKMEFSACYTMFYKQRFMHTICMKQMVITMKKQYHKQAVNTIVKSD